MKKIRHYYLAVVIQSALLTMASPAARAQNAATDGYVTRKEYEELKTQLLAMKKELDAIKREKKGVPKQESPEGQAVANMHKEVAPEVAPPVVEPEGPMLGTTKFYIAGWAEGMFEARNGSVSTFSTSFNPIFLWELTPKLF